MDSIILSIWKNVFHNRSWWNTAHMTPTPLFPVYSYSYKYSQYLYWSNRFTQRELCHSNISNIRLNSSILWQRINAKQMPVSFQSKCCAGSKIVSHVDMISFSRQNGTINLVRFILYLPFYLPTFYMCSTLPDLCGRIVNHWIRWWRPLNGRKIENEIWRTKEMRGFPKFNVTRHFIGLIFAP